MSGITMGPVLPPHSTDDTLGALYLGTVLAMAFWGAGTIQTYYYYNRYRDDAAWIKLMVAFVWIIDSAHQGMIIHTLYTYCITFYGHVEELNIIVDSIVYEVAMTATITLVVQGFFVMRIWRLSRKNYPIAVFFSLVCISEFVLSIDYTVRGLKMGNFTNLTAQLKSTSSAINGISAGADLMIAIAMIYLLHGSRTGFSKSDTIINKLIIFAMNTGTLTSLWAIASLITITVLPTTFWYIMFYFCTCKLYVNSLLATLNARRNIRGGHPDSTQEASISMNRFNGRDVEASINVSKAQRPAHTLSIKVDTETRRDYPTDNNSTKSKIPSSVDDPSSFLDTKGDAL